MKKNNNVYKPRYKVAFQAKSKVWAYKNSRLRHFYSMRGRRLFRGGFFRKNVIVSNTLKWTVARRFIKPYSRRIRARRGKTQYKSNFYLKQQVRHFYGKLTEVAFRNIYKTHLLSTLNRNKSFFGALEQRADMFLFRMRLLPTIYACNQFIHHQGLLVNYKRLEKCPSALIKIGHTISLPKVYWDSMSKYMLYRVYYRVYGKLRLKKRLHKVSRRKVAWLKARKFKRRSRHINYWRCRLQIIKMLTKFWKIFKNLFKFCVYFQKYNLFKKYNYHVVISKICLELFTYYKQDLMPTARKFFFNYKLFWKKITRYSWSRYKKLKNSPRLFILILMHNYSILREFKYIVGYVTERFILLEALIGLEELKNKSYNYDYFIKKYNINTKVLFDEKTIPFADLIIYLQEQWTKAVTDYTNYTVERNLIVEENKYLYHHFYLRSLIKKYKQRWKHYYDKVKKKNAVKPGALTYFLINRKYKKRRKRYISRFKKVHWYIPNYIYFDVRTLRGTLLYVPRANEIVHPFKCSLFKIFSFYKSLGV